METFEPVANEYALHIKTKRIVKVLKVNLKYGWYLVEFPQGGTRIYNIVEQRAHRKLSQEEKADYLLKLENSGITSNWRD